MPKKSSQSAIQKLQVSWHVRKVLHKSTAYTQASYKLSLGSIYSRTQHCLQYHLPPSHYSHLRCFFHLEASSQATKEITPRSQLKRLIGCITAPIYISFCYTDMYIHDTHQTASDHCHLRQEEPDLSNFGCKFGMDLLVSTSYTYFSWPHGRYLFEELGTYPHFMELFHVHTHVLPCCICLEKDAQNLSFNIITQHITIHSVDVD